MGFKVNQMNPTSRTTKKTFACDHVAIDNRKKPSVSFIAY